MTTPQTTTPRAFNTRRLYTQAGQRIAYAVLAQNRVAMLDLDRWIEYVLTMDTTEPVTDRAVLRAYDHHDGSMRGVWDADFQAIKSALYAAARAVPHATCTTCRGSGVVGDASHGGRSEQLACDCTLDGQEGA